MILIFEKNYIRENLNLHNTRMNIQIVTLFVYLEKKKQNFDFE